MDRSFARMAAVGAALALAGCYSTTVYTGLAPSGIVHRINSNHFVAGFVPDDVDIRTLCASGQVASVRTVMGPLDVLLAWLTIHIYTPNTVDIECAAGAELLQGAAPVVYLQPAPPPPALASPPGGGAPIIVQPVTPP